MNAENPQARVSRDPDNADGADASDPADSQPGVGDSALETASETIRSPGPGRGIDDRGAGAMPAAKTPRSTGGLASLGILLGLLMVAIGVLAVRDALIYGAVLNGTPLLHPLAKGLQGLRPQWWVVVVGVVLALVGLALLVKALLPSARKVTAVRAATGVFLRPRDVTRLVETAAEGVDGVLGVRASATPRRVTVAVRSTGDPGVEERVRDVITARLAPLQNQPSVRVRLERPSR